MTIIREGTVAEAVALSAKIPELTNPYGEQVYRERLSGTNHLILIGEVDGAPAGFKVGYDRYRDGSFYSWMGGMLPAYRKTGTYQALTARMEAWAQQQGYTHMLLKTRNRLQPMIRFCLAGGYYISGFSAHANPMESRIYFRKDLA